MHQISCEGTGNVYMIHQADPLALPPGLHPGKWYFAPSGHLSARSGRVLNEPHDYSNPFDTAEDAEAAARLYDAEWDTGGRLERFSFDSGG